MSADRTNDDGEELLASVIDKVQGLADALLPFADFYGNGSAPDDLVITSGSAMARRQLTMGDCRRAREALDRAHGVGAGAPERTRTHHSAPTSSSAVAFTPAQEARVREIVREELPRFDREAFAASVTEASSFVADATRRRLSQSEDPAGSE